jgi:3-hydroxyacyl-[acyl-carrier-protein] dehydratase
MPLNDFFTYKIISETPLLVNARVTINANHPLYKGHFPQQPVTPGVVLVEITRQILSDSLRKKLIMISAKEIKFISPVIPDQIKVIDFTIDFSETDGTINANCLISSGEMTFTKLKGDFREE